MGGRAFRYYHGHAAGLLSACKETGEERIAYIKTCCLIPLWPWDTMFACSVYILFCFSGLQCVLSPRGSELKIIIIQSTTPDDTGPEMDKQIVSL